MTSWYPGMLLALFLVGFQSRVARSLLSSVSNYSAVIPTSVSTERPILQLYLHQMPTSTSTNQSASSIRCDVTMTSQDGVEISKEESPFVFGGGELCFYARHSLETLLADDQDQTNFDILVRCSTSNSVPLTLSVALSVISVIRWHHLECRSEESITVSPEYSSSLCFAEGLKDFTVYENMMTTLGRVAPPWYTDMCPGYGDIVRNYRISTADEGYSNILKIENGELILQGKLDRETVSSLVVTITCSFTKTANQSTANKMSRDIRLNVRDVNDCGPIIYTSMGIVKVTHRTLTKDKTDRLTFQDGDFDVTLNQYSTRMVDDPQHILEYSQPKLISEKLKLYAFSLRVSRLPERDLNASLVITDEAMISRGPNEARAIYHIYVKGKKTKTSEMSSASPPGGATQTTVALDAEVRTSLVDKSTSSASRRDTTPDNSIKNINNYLVGGLHDMSASNGSVNEVEYTSEASDVSPVIGHDGDHVTLEDSRIQNAGHMTKTGISLPRELNISPEPSDLYQVNISAAAAKYTRVFEVLLVKAAFSSFHIILPDEHIPLDISPYSGIIYTTGSVRPYSDKVIKVTIRGQSTVIPFSQDLSMQVQLHVHPTTLPPSVSCDRSCSSARNESACEKMCGYGAPSGRCVWRPAGGASHYSTCVPSSETCPNEECDEDLEKIVGALCPQDCARTLTIDGKTLDVKGISRTTRGLCYCEQSLHCTCLSYVTTTLWPEDSYNGTYEHLPTEVCDTKCITVITLSLGCVVAISLVLLALCRWRHWLRLGDMKHVSSMASISAMPSDYVDDHERPSGIIPSVDWSPKQIDVHFESDPKWEVPRANLELGKVIGEGEFGRVLKARAVNIQKQQQPITVAVKMLKECASLSEFRDLLSEYNLLKDVSHRNVIKLLGVCSEKGPFFLIVEYCEHGSLHSFLRRSRHLGCYISRDSGNELIAGSQAKNDNDDNDVVITAKDCLSFAWQTTKGMSYLCDMKLVHRDLAARNLLVASGKIIKISDFGLTRDIYEGDAYLKRSKGRIPVKWMAPESLYDQVYTTKSDVWSFGVVLWEIVTLGATPYPGVPPERLYQLLRRGYRMDKPQGCSTELFCIMQQCWYEDPARRPTFRYIASMFEDMLKANATYLDLTYQCDQQLYEDDVNGGNAESLDEKASQNQSEPEYGSINILSTDNNSYVLTPSLQLNGEAIFPRWQDDEQYSNWANSVSHSPDGATEETHFLDRIDVRGGSGRQGNTQERRVSEAKPIEREGLVNENRV